MKARDITLIAVLVAILVVSQFGFSIVVGVNLVFPLLLIYTYTLGFKKGMLIMISFVGVRFLLGLPFLTVILWLWTFSVLVILAAVVNKISRGNEYVAALFTFGYFILFGLLCSVQEFILTDVSFYVYWIKGLPTDALGAVAGFITTLVLLKPLNKAIQTSIDQQQEVFTSKVK